MDVYATFTESTSAMIRFTIKDQDDVGFQPTTLAFSLYDYESKAIVNAHNNETLSPVANFITAAGVLTYNLVAADNAFANTLNRWELHVARFDVTWSSGTRRMIFELPFAVQALANL